MISTEGIMSIFKGNGTNCIRVAPFSGVEFYTFDKLKKNINYIIPSQDYQTFKYLICGILAGMVASTSVYPLDLMRTVLAS